MHVIQRSRATGMLIVVGTVLLGASPMPSHAAMTSSGVGLRSVAPASICGGLPATIVGTAGPDLIVGTPGHDVIAALRGNDVVDGKGGDDVICGGRGSDILTGGQGHDRLYGGRGSDELSGGPGRDNVEGGAGHDVVTGGAGGDVLTGEDGRDTIRGKDGSDEITGGGGADTVSGGRGADTVIGSAGADVASGGPGRDQVRGGDGVDVISGGGKDDELFGGPNGDTLGGGPGNDEMVGGAGSDTCDGNAGSERATACETVVGAHVVEPIAREAWGAAPAKPGLEPHSIEHVTVHHAGTATGTVGPAQFLGWQTYHFSLGWPDIAYHFIVGRDGFVYEARDWTKAGDTATSYDPWGHFLIVVEGNFESDVPTASQLERLAAVAAWASERFDIPPSEIAGHRDHAPETVCPGASLYAAITDGSLEAAVDSVIAEGGVTLVAP